MYIRFIQVQINYISLGIILNITHQDLYVLSLTFYNNRVRKEAIYVRLGIDIVFLNIRVRVIYTKF